VVFISARLEVVPFPVVAQPEIVASLKKVNGSGQGRPLDMGTFWRSHLGNRRCFLPSFFLLSTFHFCRIRRLGRIGELWIAAMTATKSGRG
jgi:hypothetical protein